MTHMVDEPTSAADAALVAALLRHDHDAWHGFLREYRRYCAGIAAHYGLQHERDDLFSEFLLKLLGRPPTRAGALQQYRPGSALLPFLTAILHHVALDRLRRIKARIMLVAAPADGDCHNAGAPAVSNDMRTSQPSDAEIDVLDAVALLPDNQQRLIELHYYHGFTVRELAAILGASKSNVALQLQRTHATLRQHMLARGWTTAALDAY